MTCLKYQKEILGPMSEVRDFFRHCPACGRRFHIKLVSKKLVDDRKVVSHVTRGEIPSAMVMGYTRGSMPLMPVLVEESIPITVEIEDFQFTYKCKHCGHVWSEMHEEESNP